MFKIEKDVPMPDRCKYPFREMEVGESFFVQNGNMQNVRGSVPKDLNRAGQKFTMRSVEGGVRCWRFE